jgi:hypothetical protein
VTLPVPPQLLKEIGYAGLALAKELLDEIPFVGVVAIEGNEDVVVMVGAGFGPLDRALGAEGDRLLGSDELEGELELVADRAGAERDIEPDPVFGEFDELDIERCGFQILFAAEKPFAIPDLDLGGPIGQVYDLHNNLK